VRRVGAGVRPADDPDRAVGALDGDQAALGPERFETLVREVSDSLRLRRFRRIALTELVPDESTIRKL
jgi:hypothetical protein